MHFQGQELISRGTKATNRSLLFTSFAVLLLPFSSLDLAGSVELLSLSFPAGIVSFCAVALTVYLVVAHVISWWGDHLSYQNWNLPGKTPSRYFDTSAGMRSQTEQSFERFDNILQRIELVVEEDSDPVMVEKILKSDFSKNLDEARSTRDFLEEMNAGVDRLNGFASFVLYGWFLAVPLSVAAFAILVSLGVFPITELFEPTPPVEVQEAATE